MRIQLRLTRLLHPAEGIPAAKTGRCNLDRMCLQLQLIPGCEPRAHVLQPQML